MPLRTSIRTFKSLGTFVSKFKKKGQSPDLAPSQPAVMAGSASKPNPDYKINSTIYHLKNFDELIKRLHNLFLRYQIPLFEGRPIVFDEFRSSQALNLRILLCIQAPDLLESDQMASNFELHNLGLRSPANPLRMNPTCNLKIKIRQAMREELGPVFANTSLEALGLITILHVLEKAISWLEPLLSAEGIKRVQINVKTARQTVEVLTHESGDSKISNSSEPNRRSTSYASNSSDATDGSTVKLRRHSQIPNWRFPPTPHEETGSTDVASQVQDPIAVPTFTPGHNAYNFNKELPENALDRWVLEARSHGYEPTLDECVKKLQNLTINYRVARQERGILPPPVSTRHGRVQHALYLHQQRDPRRVDQSLPSSFPAQQSSQQETGKIVGEAYVPRPSTPYRHRRTTQQINRASANTVLNRHCQPARPPLSVVQESPTACKTPTRLLCLNGSPSRVQKSNKMKIGSPSKITHHATGAGLASYNDILKAMLAANEDFSHAKQVDSATFDIASKPQANHDKLMRKDLSKASAPDAAARKYTFQNIPSTISRSVAPYPQQLNTETTELHDLSADKQSQHCATATNSSIPEQTASQAWTPSVQPSSIPLDDQDAKVEALLTQLRLMQDVFEKARDSLAKSVGPRFIERVTDIAVAYGWFRASCGSYDQDDWKTNGYGRSS